MSYSSSSLICDYITVFLEDGKITSNVGEWDIPASSYYYQTRGLMALVSVADVMFNADGDSNVLIGFENGMNGSVAQVGSTDLIPNNLSILGNIYQTSNPDVTTDGQFAFNKTEPIKVLTSARPSKIRLHFYKDNKNTRDVTRGAITLKFEYLSPLAEKEVNDAVSYVPAFPEPTNF